MAREILFKAKRTDNGEWVEGFYFEHAVNHFIVDRNNTHIRATYLQEDIYDFDLRAFIVDINTLCQYTGKKINRKKCFEGDVIFARHSLLYVGWDDVFLMWMTYYFDDVGNQITFCPLCDIADWETEDIRGNIFDNPELLGGGE